MSRLRNWARRVAERVEDVAIALALLIIIARAEVGPREASKTEAES